MKCFDTKRMIYSFYINDESFEHPINKLHFKLLERYIHKFDEVIFCIIIDDKERYDLIQRIENFIISIFHKQITFKVYENTNYRESLVFYNEIASKMEYLDGVTFFGHNKGISDTASRESIEMWVAAMYYFNLEFDVPFDLNGYLFYGALKSGEVKISCLRETLAPRYDWFYCGTFFWGKYQDVYRYINNNNIKIPLLCNRWYSEMFPGEITSVDNGLVYCDRYVLGGVVENDNILDFLKWTYEGTDILNNFLRFNDEIKNYEYSDMCNM